ncbi:roundabout 1 [Carabus blaptoides fortunei]
MIVFYVSSTGAPAGGKGVLSLIVQDPQDVTVAKGQPATLRCVVNSSEPDYTVTWLHGTEFILPNDTRRQVLEDGSLYIRKVAGKKFNTTEGQYSCFVRNKFGALLSSPAQLRIAMLAKEFSQQPQDDSVKMTQPVVLPCQLHSTPDAVVQWERNSNPLPQSTRYVPLPSGDLLITMAQNSDAGSYRCIVLNVVTKKNRTSVEGRLYVLPTPDTLHPPQLLTVNRQLNITAHMGTQLVLYCVATGWPTPTIRWIYNASAVLGNSSILRISKVNVTNAGPYMCTAQNSAGQTSQIFHVNVVQMPSFNSTPMSKSFPSARMVKLDCQANGIPKPTIRWMKNGMPLLVEGRFKPMPYGLLISHTFSTDSGIYQCIAENTVGRIWSAAQLIANLSATHPAPPVNVRCNSYNRTSICLQWDPSPNGLVIVYSIHSFHAGKMEPESITNATYYLAKGLLPETNYTFYIRGYTNEASDPSNTITCQTVLMGSRNLQLKAASHTALRADWTTLSSDTPCGGVAEYKLQWRRFRHASNNVQHVSENHYIIKGLIPTQRYEVRVQTSGNEDDDLPWTDYTMPNRNGLTDNSSANEGADTILPNLNRTVMPPVQLEAEPVSPYSINLTWRDPRHATDRLVGGYYMICYTEVKLQHSCDNYVKSTTTSYEIKNLNPYTLYEFKVRSHNLDGNYGTFSQAVECRTVESAPASITNLMSRLENSTSVCLRWRIPNASNGQLQGYVISYSLLNQSLDQWPTIFLPVDKANLQSCWRSSADTVSMHLTPLEPGREYKVVVRARNRAGLSAANEPVIVRTTTGPLPTFIPTLPPHQSNNTDELHHNQKLGIIVGIGIALMCIVACITCMIFRRRCLKARALERARLYAPRTTNGQSAGNTSLSVSAATVPAPCQSFESGDHLHRPRTDEVHELQCLVTVDPATTSASSTHIPPLPHSHLDTKGGVSYPNGHLNGLKFVANGHVPNGNMHITENPQYEPYDCNGHYDNVNSESHQLLDTERNPIVTVDDSLLLNDSFNATQLTSLDESLPRPPSLSTVLRTVSPVLDPNG